MKQHKCEIGDGMVHSCRVLLGAHAAGYPGVPGNFDAQHLAHARRNGIVLDLVHDYAPAGRLPFDDRYTVTWARNRHNSRIVHNWNPVARWREADSPAAWDHFRLAARRVRLLHRPCSIIVHHEPERDLAQRGVRKAASGTPEEYRRMWAIVREIFADEGAHNVTWGVAYMNCPKWDAVVPELYPGDDLVDWIWCNAYGSVSQPDVAANIGRFVDVVDRCGIGFGKSFGIAEWGVKDLPVDLAVAYFDQAHDFLDTPESDRVNAWMVFDAPGSTQRCDLRVGFDAEGLRAVEQAAAYRRFAQHRRFRCHVR